MMMTPAFSLYGQLSAADTRDLPRRQQKRGTADCCVRGYLAWSSLNHKLASTNSPVEPYGTHEYHLRLVDSLTSPPPIFLTSSQRKKRAAFLVPAVVGAHHAVFLTGIASWTFDTGIIENDLPDAQTARQQVNSNFVLRPPYLSYFPHI
jgi:hypothetical protein